MLTFAEYTITGLATAGIYAILASGLTLTYMTTGVFNFAHGAIGMASAFCFWQLRFGWGLPAPVSWALCILILAPALGLAIEWAVMRRLEESPESVRLVVTVALMLALVSLALTLWNPSTFRVAQPLFSGDVFTVAGIRIAYNSAIVLAIAALVGVGLWMLLFRTSAGIAMRATVDNPDLVRLSGCEPQRSSRQAWVISTMLAAVAGILIAPTLTLSALPLTLLIVNAYAAAIIGRLRSLAMTFVGALVLGLLTSYAVGYVRSEYLQGLSGTLPAILLFAALLVLRPSRLAAHQTQRVPPATAPTWRGGIGLAGTCVIGSLMLVPLLSHADLFASLPAWGFAIVALSLVPLAGYGRRLSLCQLTFAGLGAVIVAHAGSTIPSILLAGIVCAALGALVSLPALRLTGIYMALATAAVALAFDNWIWQLPAFTILGHRINIFGGGTLAISRPHLLGLSLGGSKEFFVFGAVMFGLCVLAVVGIRRSIFGDRVVAIADSQVAAASLGLDVRRHTLLVFSLSAALAGIGGAIYGMAVQSTTPDSFSFFAGLPILLFMVVGGLDSLGFAAVCGLIIGTPLSGIGPIELVPFTVGSLAVVIGRYQHGVAAVVRERSALLRTTLWAPLTLAAGLLVPWVLCVAHQIGTTLWLILTLAVVLLAGVIERVIREVSAGAPQHEDVRRGLSAPVETLGLLSPYRSTDVLLIDRVLALPSRASDA